jgi:hypothetical protein
LRKWLAPQRPSPIKRIFVIEINGVERALAALETAG